MVRYILFIKFFLLVMFLRYLTLKLTNEITCQCSCHLKGIFVSVSVAYFFSWNSRWIVRQSPSEHRHTYFISIVGRSAFKHFDFFFSKMSAGRQQFTRVDWSLWAILTNLIGWSRTDRLQISLNIYRLSVDKRPSNAAVFFVNAL